MQVAGEKAKDISYTAVQLAKRTLLVACDKGERHIVTGCKLKLCSRCYSRKGPGIYVTVA